jgi:hypothetical protein
MSQHETFERIATLLNEILDLLQRGDDAPYSPVSEFVDGRKRREMRRGAVRLRRGQIRPRFTNLWNARQLAEICERTVARDEIRHQVTQEFIRKGEELACLLAEDPEGTQLAMFAFHLQARRLADAHGPGSEAARRWSQLQRLTQLAKTYDSDARRQKTFDRPHHLPADDRVVRIPMVPAEILDSAPPGAAIVPIPAPGQDSGRPRILMRVGIGASSWIGSFESGFKPFHTLFMMPDNEHLFVVAGGAGYIVYAKSRKLVERTGTDIVSVTHITAAELVVVHNYAELEAFGPAGRLWKRPAPRLPSTTIPA